MDRYDASCGTPFEAYAWVLILGELMHFVRDSECAIRPPRKLRELDKRWSRTHAQMLNERGREPSEREIAARLGLGESDCRDLRAYRNSRHPVSLDALKPGSQRLAYRLEDHLESLAREELFAELSPLERRIVSAIYELGLPLNVVAGRVGYSRRHTTRLHRTALAKLRRAYAAARGV